MTMRELWEHLPSGLKYAGDALSIATLLGSLTDALPAIASAVTIIWTCIRIYETATVQRLLRRRGEKP